MAGAMSGAGTDSGLPPMSARKTGAFGKSRIEPDHM
jgi:hypothetical protein